MKAVLLQIMLFYTLAGWCQSYVPEKNNALVKVQPVAPMKAYAFNLSDVQLLPGPFHEAMQADVRYLLSIEPDRLLSQFRSHSGLQPKAERYGGWESEGLAGHTLGHYLSACAMHFATAGDTAFLNRVRYVVTELDECQRARKTGYIGAIPREDSVFMEVSQGNIRSRGFDLNGAWSPWYTIHKVMAGLLDAYLYCGDERALRIETGMADWAERILENLNDTQLQKMLLCEYGGMNEVLVNTYALTSEKKYLDLSYKFHDTRLLDSLAIGFDVLPGKHSNTQVPKAIGTARRYQLTGDKKDFAISEFFWNTVVRHHTYAPGGNSNYEYLGKQDALSEKLTDNTMETCNTYNMLKLTRLLFALKPSAHLMDFYERALYNHILASQDHQRGMMCYFVPLRMGTRKEFSDPFNTFTCCVGSGMENHVKYNESIYFQSADGGLYVNLFIPSKLTWKEKGITAIMKSNLPESDVVSISIQTKRVVTFPLYIRKPDWSGEVILKINRKPFKMELNGEGYLVVSRAWKNGDVVELTLSSALRTMPMPDNSHRQAFFYGPLLLAGDLGDTQPDPANGVPVFVTDEPKPQAWMRRDEKNPLKFSSVKTGVPRDVTFVPFYQIQDQFYSVYWDVFTSAQWEEENNKYEQARQAAYELEQSTVDLLRLGEMQPERDHAVTGEKTEAGEKHTRRFRTAKNSGYFSCRMKVDPATANIVMLTFWGEDNRGRTFDILVDDVKVATEDINKYKDSRFYDIAYPVPVELTRGKESIVVKFVPKERNEAGPVFAIRVVRDAR